MVEIINKDTDETRHVKVDRSWWEEGRGIGATHQSGRTELARLGPGESITLSVYSQGELIIHELQFKKP